MRVEFCDLCKVNSDFPEGCLSCAHKNERARRLELERQLLDLLGLMRGIANKTESVVRAAGVDTTVPLLPSGE